MLDADRLAAKLREHGLPCIGDVFTDERGVGFLIGVKPRTLRAWRAEKRGPPAALVNRWLYDLAALAEWITAQTQRQQPAGTGIERQQPAAGDIASDRSGRKNQTVIEA